MRDRLLEMHPASVTAWALRCFEVWLQRQNVQRTDLNELLDHVWKWLSVDQNSFEEWHDHPPNLIEVGLGGKLPPDLENLFDGTDAAKFHNALMAVTELAYSGFFGALDLDLHCEYAESLARLLHEAASPVPDPSTFAVPDELMLVGQQSSIPGELVERWRELR